MDFDFDEILDGEGNLVKVSSDGIVMRDQVTVLEVESYDKVRAEEFLSNVSVGKSLKQTLSLMKMSQMTFNNWLGVKEFKKAYMDAKSAAAEYLLDQSFEEDVLASYHKNTDIQEVKRNKLRHDLVESHLKLTVPDRFTSGDVSINSKFNFTINMGDVKKEEAISVMAEAVPVIADNGGIVLGEST